MYISLFILAFAGSLFTIISGGAAIQKGLIFLLSTTIIIFHLDRKIKKPALYIISPYIYYILIMGLFSYGTFGSALYTAAAIQPFMLGIIFYFALITMKAESCKFDHIKSMFIAICVLQILFAIVKLLYHGVDEKVLIGTMSHSAGQLGFLFPAIAVPILLFFLRENNRNLILLLVAGMFLFGIINEKRAIVYLLPLIFIFSLFANKTKQRQSISKISVMHLLAIVTIPLLGIVLGPLFIPSLNVEGSYFGSFNVLHMFEYALDYLTMDYGGPLQGSFESARSDINIQVGRITLMLSIVNWFSELDWASRLFGLGLGTVTPSEWLGGHEDPLFRVLNTRGAISGAGVALIETGLVGLGLFVVLFLKLFTITFKYSQKAQTVDARRWYRTVIILLGVFAFDFFFYSTILLRTLPMPIIFFSIIASIPLAMEYDRRATRCTHCQT